MGNFVKYLKLAGNFLLDLLYPPKCPACDKIVKSGLCDECKVVFEDLYKPHLLSIGGYVDACYYFFSYRNSIIKEMLIRAKSQGEKNTVNTIGDFYARFINETGSMKNADVITFCTRRKMQKRRTGIDQSELIAKRISLLTGIKCKKLLKRKGFIRKQHVLNYERRWKNVKNSFVALPFEEKTILLIDDICTTGATVNEAARTLKKAGAKRVYVLSFAH